jgi:hypothetical protein
MIEAFFYYHNIESNTFFGNLGKNINIYYDKCFESFNMENAIETAFEGNENLNISLEEMLIEEGEKRILEKDSIFQKYYNSKCKEIIIKYSNILFHLKKQNINRKVKENYLEETFLNFQKEIEILKIKYKNKQKFEQIKHSKVNLFS